MKVLLDFITNHFIVTSVFSWCFAQVCKVFIHAAVHKDFDILRLFGDGGMPSGHSATVSSLATLAALEYGAGSFQFGVCAILAIIVCHDATHVRLETQKQAAIILELQQMFENLPDMKLKEFVGHTPVQVGAGVLIGILNACVSHFWILPALGI